PLALEAVGPRPPRGAAEVEPGEAFLARTSEDPPVQEHVRAQGAMFAQRGGPRNDQAVLETQGDQTAEHPLALAHEHGPGVVTEAVEDRTKELATMDWRTQVSHVRRKTLVEGIQKLRAIDLQAQTRALRLSHLVADLSVDLSPQSIGTGRQREGQVHLRRRRFHSDVDAVPASHLYSPRAQPARFLPEPP